MKIYEVLEVCKMKATMEQKIGQAVCMLVVIGCLVCRNLGYGPVQSLACSRDCQGSLFVGEYTSRCLGAVGEVGMA